NVHGEVDAGAGGTLSDDAGVVRFGRLPCTRYDLWIEGPAEPAGADGDDLPAVLFRALDVKPGDGTQAIELTVPRAGSVKGLLLRVDGKTPAEKHVVAVQTGTVPGEDTSPARRMAAYARGAQGCYAEAEVAADGTFVLHGLAPGEHSLDIRRPDRLEPWCTVSGVEVLPGQVTDLGAVEVAWNGWQHMFDRKTLDGWGESDFYGQKEVRIENDRILLSQGRDMTGITWKKDIPRVDYEVSLEAMRVGGDDFFCGLTFPVQEDYCSLILGGWGGSVVGLSSLDGYDASENETSDWIQFDNRRWYRVRVRVTQSKIEAWLDGENIVDVETKNRHIDTRIEVEPSKPFGIATWCTSGAVRDIRMRWLDTKAP
ncbi:MAG: family 16 glycoside hydrolase, partial [Armatimonadota bacterium]